MKNKLYRIRIDNFGYVKAIVFDIEPTLRVMPTMEIEEAGIYEEDKANIIVIHLTMKIKVKILNLLWNLLKIYQMI